MNVIDLETVCDWLSKNMMMQDGLSIKDFINENTELDAEYTEDSLWVIDGTLRDELDLKKIVHLCYEGLDGAELAEAYNSSVVNHPQSPNKIKYDGDGFFLNTDSYN